MPGRSGRGRGRAAPDPGSSNPDDGRRADRRPDYLPGRGRCLPPHSKVSQGNLITPFVEGAYVSWELWPDVKVSLDSRFDVAYQDGLLEEQERFYRMEAGWQEFLWRYPTDAVLLRRTAGVLSGLSSLPGWAWSTRTTLTPWWPTRSAPPLCRLFRPDHPGQISLTSSRKRLSRPDCVFGLPGKPAGVENDVPTPYPCPYPPGKKGRRQIVSGSFLKQPAPAGKIGAEQGLGGDLSSSC